ncbi:MAG: YceI family protein [Spirosomataceae bacterium]
MKNFFTILFFTSFTTSLFAQNQWICKDGTTSFFSATAVEDISAKNKKVASLLDISSKEIVVKMYINQFQFTNQLMEEHFNENYLESDKFPTSVFQGKIQEDIDFKKVGEYPISALGTLQMHGISKKTRISGKVKVEKGKITLDAKFDVLLPEFGVEVPSIVVAKVSEKMAVTNHFIYLPKP